MVQVHLGPPVGGAVDVILRELDGVNAVRVGGIAQLGERLPCTQEAIGSNPFTSTKSFP